MIAWEPLTKDKPRVGEPATPVYAGLLYRFALAFPAWAGAILALYGIFVSKSHALRIRPR